MGHFRRDCPLRKKYQDGERGSSDFLGSVVGSSEEVDDLLEGLEESMVYVGIEWSSKESTVCAGTRQTVTEDEV